jgi:hypothetical protein
LLPIAIREDHQGGIQPLRIGGESMAKITERPNVGMSMVFTVDEGEARALDALAGYGDDAFIKVFYEELGEAYMKEHEADLRRFLKSIREQVPSYLHLLDEARSVFNREKIAVTKGK